MMEEEVTRRMFRLPRFAFTGLLLLIAASLAPAQVIEFESGGLQYRTLTRRGVTLMFAELNTTLRDFAILQVAVSNGSAQPAVIQPTSFVYHRNDGTEVRAADTVSVINQLVQKANRNDVLKLVAAYEQGLYGIVRFRSTNGFEQRRQAAITEMTSTRLKAAAAASAIAMVETQLAPGDSTDGVIFFPTLGKPLGEGYLRAVVQGELFDFQQEPAPQVLQVR
jgi:hypothetical protein